MQETNIFDFFGKHHSEKIHSQFIATLFNINIEYKKMFFEIINKKNNVNLDCKATLEHRLNNKEGRVDIYISDKYGSKKNGNIRIIIENKIFARDQKEQMYRYSKFLEKYNGYLLYLTLDGRAPKSYSTKNKQLEFYKISYPEHIVPWLKKVKKINTDSKIDILIVDYLKVVEKLTEIDNMVKQGYENSINVKKNQYDAYLELKFWQYLEEK